MRHIYFLVFPFLLFCVTLLATGGSKAYAEYNTVPVGRPILLLNCKLGALMTERISTKAEIEHFMVNCGGKKIYVVNIFGKSNLQSHPAIKKTSNDEVERLSLRTPILCVRQNYRVPYFYGTWYAIESRDGACAIST